MAVHVNKDQVEIYNVFRCYKLDNLKGSLRIRGEMEKEEQLAGIPSILDYWSCLCLQSVNPLEGSSRP